MNKFGIHNPLDDPTQIELMVDEIDALMKEYKHEGGFAVRLRKLLKQYRDKEQQKRDATRAQYRAWAKQYDEESKANARAYEDWINTPG
jgi:hypothetical protein